MKTKDSCGIRFQVPVISLLASYLSGCNVGPKYKQPAYPAPPAFHGTDEAAVVSDAQNSLGDQQWSQVFREPELQDLIRKELGLIARLGYARYFLTVHDIVRFARSLETPILCQGRGSAANSAVCYCLGVTAIDPREGNSLLARFLSEERKEPPDIDVDFEHERREEVMQYIYRRYGRHRAGIVATVIHFDRDRRCAKSARRWA